MATHHDNEAIRTPDRLDYRIGVVAGLYVAALLTPVLVMAFVYRFRLDDSLLTVGLLGVVGTATTAVVAWKVSRWGGIVSWFNSTWLAVLVPALGIFSAIVYLVQVILYLGYFLSDLQPDTTASLVGFIGFALAILAGCLGGVLTLMARTRMVRASIEEADVDIEWAAGWPLKARVKYAMGVIILAMPFFGISFWQLGWWGVNIVGFLLALLIVGLVGLVSERGYRVTPAGLEQRWQQGGVTASKIIPWAGFNGLTVTDDAIVLHRPTPHFDVRVARYDLAVDEAKVLEALQNRLETTVT